MSATVALVGAVALLAGCQDAETRSTPSATASATPSAPTGNGVAALAPDEILQRAKDALKKAKSFQVKGTVNDGSQVISVDFGVSGADFAGSMSVGGARVDLLAIGGKRYMRPSEKFWSASLDPKQAKLFAKTFRDRWITVADSDKQFAALFSAGDVDELLKPTGTVTKGAEKEVAGQPAITLVDGKPSQLLFIATSGEPYPLQVTGDGGSAMTFSGFGEPVPGLRPPPADKVVDLGKSTTK
ncbi:hypothetical protein KRMM14A1004_32860 [Krasilnikovia sp. MM14-A1004]